MERVQILEADTKLMLYAGGTGFLATFIIVKLIGPALSRVMVPSYRPLPHFTKADWNDRLLSNANAVVSLALAGYSLLYESGIHADKVWYDSYYARVACALMVGYMVADIIVMFLWCRVSRSDMLSYIFHHAATVYAYYYISVYGVLCYFGMLRLLAEASTPFVNQRWFFDTLDVPRKRKTVILNGFLMVLTFFMFRMVTLPIYWYQIWIVTGTEAVRRLGHIQLIMFIPTFVLDVLNIYWFYKMCKGFIKAIKKLNSSNNNNDADKFHEA